MSWFKFSLVVLIIFSISNVYARRFTDMECIRGDYKTSVSHKGQPFGLTQNVLEVSKEQCVIRVSHEKLKFMKNNWVIDVCREPVHIKEGVGAVDILKREGECTSTNSSDYCSALGTLKGILQDDGLIFATGEKENLNSDHGKVYCSYLLVKSYLERGFVFSRHSQYTNILEPEQGRMNNVSNRESSVQKKESPLPAKTESEPTKNKRELFNF